MITRTPVTDILRNFSDYINRVAYRGERFLLIRGGRAVAELTPVPRHTRVGDLPEILAGLPRLGKDEADAFAEDLSRARRELGIDPPRSPWES